jgi:hypothetical protein
MAADHIDFWFTMGSTLLLFDRDEAFRATAIERRPIPLATIPLAHHTSRNEARSVRGQASKISVHVA